MVDFSIIVVNYNTAELTLQTIRSFFKYHPQKNYHFYVLDNASSAPDFKKLQQATVNLSHFTLLRSETNLGFGGGNNFVAEKVQSKYLFFLNSDVIITENLLSPLLKFFNEHPRAAIASPALKLESGGEQKFSHGKFPTLKSLIFDRQKNYPVSSSAPIATDWVSGCALAIKNNVFEQVGGFSPEYFMYFEDIDLCKKVSLAGYQTYYLPHISLIHLGGQSIKLVGERRKIYFASQTKFFTKFYGFWRTTFLKICRLPYRLRKF